MGAAREIWTIGHWTCPRGTFLAPLAEQRIEWLVDARARPESGRDPDFRGAALAAWLGEDGIGSTALPALGSSAVPPGTDPAANAGWRDPAMKRYADHTLGEEYRRGIDELEALAASRRVVLLCGGPMPWRSPRLLIANTLAADGWAVHHLAVDHAPVDHVLGRWGATPGADGAGRLTYPARPGGPEE